MFRTPPVCDVVSKIQLISDSVGISDRKKNIFLDLIGFNTP
jgi:hypothetical protein